MSSCNSFLSNSRTHSSLTTRPSLAARQRLISFCPLRRKDTLTRVHHLLLRGREVEVHASVVARKTGLLAARLRTAGLGVLDASRSMVGLDLYRLGCDEVNYGRVAALDSFGLVATFEHALVVCRDSEGCATNVRVREKTEQWPALEGVDWVGDRHNMLMTSWTRYYVAYIPLLEADATDQPVYGYLAATIMH